MYIVTDLCLCELAGPFSSEDEAREAAERLEADGWEDAQVIPVD